MKKFLISVSALVITLYTHAQEVPKLKVNGYVETYYGYDFNKPVTNDRPDFVYSHNRHNEVNLNLGFIKAAFDSRTVRANLALMAGTYTNANLAAEPGVLKNIFEANAGVKLSETQNIWVDAGIFSSHIGFESAISKDCWVLTRSIAAENTPFYEAGAKITYGSTEGEFTISLLYLNGWQRINRVNGNSKPAGGIQLTYKPTGKLTFNYSNYLGKEGIDAVAVTRFYHNLYAIAQLTNNFGITAGFDYAIQQKVKGKEAKNEVISPILIAQYRIDSKFAVAARTEYYSDKNGVFIAMNTQNGFKTMAYSLNFDYAPISNAVLRLEGKLYDSKDKVFTRNLASVNKNATVTASIAVSF